MFSHLYFMLTFVQMILARVMVLTCVINDDCNDGYSCHKGLCTKCFKCNLLLRKGSDCVIDFNECGECLVGYETVLITDSSKALKPCKPVRLKEKLYDHKCANDDTCSPDYYCHEGSCVNCFNCSIVNRVSLAGNCPKLLNDCGPCMNGYEEVAVTMNTHLRHCERQSVTAKHGKLTMNTFGFISSTGLLLIVLIGATVHLFIKRPKVKIISKSQFPELPSAPPWYTVDVPQYVKRLEEEPKSEVALVMECTQQAKVFKHPNAPYYYREDETQDCHPGSENSAQTSTSNLWTPARNEPYAEMVHLSEFFNHNYTEQSVGTSTTDSPQQSAGSSVTGSLQEPNDGNQSPVSANELDDNQLADFSIEDVGDSSNPYYEKNPSM